MQNDNPKAFNLNGRVYDANKLSPEGQRLIALLTEAQIEMGRLETRQALIQAAKQELINQLKPLLPEEGQVGHQTVQILGKPSSQIPTTSVNQPTNNPEPLPKNTPKSIRNK